MKEDKWSEKIGILYFLYYIGEQINSKDTNIVIVESILTMMLVIILFDGLGSLAPIATGITSILGLIGLIIYIVFYVINGASSSAFSKEIIEALNQANIPINEIKRLPEEKLKLLLEKQLNLSVGVIDKGINKESERRINLMSRIVLMCFVLSVFFGVLWALTLNHEYNFSTHVLDESKQPIQGVKLECHDQFGVRNSISDMTGKVGCSVHSQEVAFIFSHPQYDTITLNKQFVKGKDITDTFIAMKLRKRKHYVKLTGNVKYSGSMNGYADSAMISIDGAPQIAYSGKPNGFFCIGYDFSDGEFIIIRAIKGKKSYSALKEAKDSSGITLLIK